MISLDFFFNPFVYPILSAILIVVFKELLLNPRIGSHSKFKAVIEEIDQKLFIYGRDLTATMRTKQEETAHREMRILAGKLKAAYAQLSRLDYKNKKLKVEKVIKELTFISNNYEHIGNDKAITEIRNFLGIR